MLINKLLQTGTILKYISMSQKAENEYTRDNHFSVIQASYAASNKPTTIYIHGGPKKFNFFPYTISLELLKIT